jgi:hypothetical protein
MRRLIVRRSLPFLVLLLASVAACGQGGQSNSSTSTSSPSGDTANSAADVAQMSESGEGAPPARPGIDRPSREGGPNIGTTAAPDVAFNYRYGFRLAADRIAGVQNEHQQLCEHYTLARCRITGMTYRAVTEDDVEATMTFALDPALAREFGQEAVQRVSSAEGSVTESEIDGNDVGSAIRASGRTLADLQSDLERIETRLAALDRGSRMKSDLEAEAAQIREQIRAIRESRNAQAETLATTPVIFRYGSGTFAPGVDQGPTLSEAAQETGQSALYGLYILLRILIILSPWAVGAALIWGAIRLVRRRRPAAQAAAPIDPETA